MYVVLRSCFIRIQVQVQYEHGYEHGSNGIISSVILLFETFNFEHVITFNILRVLNNESV